MSKWHYLGAKTTLTVNAEGAVFLIIMIIKSNPGTHLTNHCMTSRHSSGFSLHGQELVMEHRVCGWNTPNAVEGRKYSTGLSATLPDFSSSVFIALTGFPHGVFLPPAQWKGLSSRLIQHHSLSQSLSDRLIGITSWLVCPDFQLYVVQISISLNSAIFLYTAGPATFEFILWPRPFIELSNNLSITEPTTSTQERTRFSRMGVGTPNLSTSRDGWCCLS